MEWLEQCALDHVRYFESLRDSGFDESSCFLERAALRYQAFLLLQAEHPSAVLVPTNDIEFMWRIHLLHPVTYASDLLNAGLPFLDHKPRQFFEEEMLDDFTASAWKRTYGCDLLNGTPLLKQEVASLDLVDAAQRQGSFMKKCETLWFGQSNDSLLGFASAAVKRYDMFLRLLSQRKTLSVPPLDVDLVWHSHQLNAARYAADCKRLFGKTLNHDDNLAPDRLSAEHFATKLDWEKMFDLPYEYCHGCFLDEHVCQLPHNSSSPSNSKNTLMRHFAVSTVISGLIFFLFMSNLTPPPVRPATRTLLSAGGTTSIVLIVVAAIVGVVALAFGCIFYRNRKLRYILALPDHCDLPPGAVPATGETIRWVSWPEPPQPQVPQQQPQSSPRVPPPQHHEHAAKPSSPPTTQPPPSGPPQLTASPSPSADPAVVQRTFVAEPKGASDAAPSRQPEGDATAQAASDTTPLHEGDGGGAEASKPRGSETRTDSAPDTSSPREGDGGDVKASKPCGSETNLESAPETGAAHVVEEEARSPTPLAPGTSQSPSQSPRRRVPPPVCFVDDPDCTYLTTKGITYAIAGNVVLYEGTRIVAVRVLPSPFPEGAIVLNRWEELNKNHGCAAGGGCGGSACGVACGGGGCGGGGC